MSLCDYNDLIEKFINQYGEEELVSYLKSRVLPSEQTLTLIGNEGTHAIPSEFLYGEIYAVTSGNLSLGTREEIYIEYTEALVQLIKKLKEKPWRMVYLVPTGPVTLVLQIKVFVYNILRISTVDLFYSRGRYIEIDIDYRKILNNNG